MKKSFLILISLCLLTLTGCNLKKVVIYTAEDLAGKKIGVQKGTTGEEYARNKVDNAIVTSYKTILDAAEDLKNGDVDAIVIDEYPAIQVIKDNPSLMIIRDKMFEENKEEYAIAVKKGNTELLNSINETINELQQNGKYDGLIKTFMIPDGITEIPEITPASANKILKLGTNAMFPPFEYVQGKDVVGFDISLGEYIAQKNNARLQIVDMNFAVLLQALKSGTIDFAAAAISITDERKKEVDFSVPYFSSEQVIIIRK